MQVKIGISGPNVRIGIKPPVTDEQRERIVNDVRMYDFRNYLGDCMLKLEPQGSEPHTQIDCEELVAQMAQDGNEDLVLQPTNLAREISEILTSDGTEVSFDPSNHFLGTNEYLF